MSIRLWKTFLSSPTSQMLLPNHHIFLKRKDLRCPFHSLIFSPLLDPDFTLTYWLVLFWCILLSSVNSCSHQEVLPHHLVHYYWKQKSLNLFWPTILFPKDDILPSIFSVCEPPKFILKQEMLFYIEYNMCIYTYIYHIHKYHIAVRLVYIWKMTLK